MRSLGLLRWTGLLLLLFTFLPCSSWGQRSDSQPSLKLSPSRLARVDAVVQDYVDRGRIPGAVALVAQAGEPMLFEAYGWADVENREPMRRHSLFRLASMTKAVTSVAVMMLYEEGRFRLDDPVARFLPAFERMQYLADEKRYGLDSLLPARNPITIRQLLSHSSGIVYPWDGGLGRHYLEEGIAMGLAYEEFTTAEGIDHLAEMPLRFAPGSRWNYGLNTDVLGRLVEVISGQSLDEFFQERIFVPLGMKNTWFYVPDSARARLTQVYGVTRDFQLELREAGTFYPNGRSPFSVDYAYREQPPRYLSGGAGLVSNTEDYLRFLNMLLFQGRTPSGEYLLSPRSIELMTRDQLAGIDYRPGKSFGLGFEVLTNPMAAQEIGSEGEFRWGGFFSTHFWVDPETELVMILMMQMHPDRRLDLPAIFRNLCYQALRP